MTTLGLPADGGGYTEGYNDGLLAGRTRGGGDRGLTFEGVRSANLRRLKSVCDELGAWSGLEWGAGLSGAVGRLLFEMRRLQALERGFGGGDGEWWNKDGAIGERLKDNGVIRKELIQTVMVLLGDAYLYLDLLTARYNWEMGDVVRAAFNRQSEEIGHFQRL